MKFTSCAATVDCSKKQKVRSVKVTRLKRLVNPEQEKKLNGVLEQQKVGEFTAAEYEEMTDVAERLRAPMDHAIRFKNIDGKLYTESSVDGKDLLTISREAEFAALEMAKQNPQWTVEAYRRHIESEEIVAASALPDGAQMIVYSPTPDVVLSGAVNIGGYNTEKATVMVRAWQNRDGHLDCRYISLDGGNKAALRISAQSINREIPEDYDSELILATFYTFPEEDETLVEKLVDGYDEEMRRQTGVDHSYGRMGLNHKKALDIALENPDRLYDHMAEIARLKWSYEGEDLREKLEEARYNYAAALDKTSRGEAVSSNSIAGGEARAVGADFSGYCATTPGENSAQSNEDAYNSMFGKKVTGKCPCCGETTTYDPCDPECGVCHSTPGNDRSAEYIAKKKAELEKMSAEEYKKGRESTTGHEKKSDAGKKVMSLIKKFIWGDGAFSPIEKAVGYHGEIIAEGKAAQDLYNLAG